MAYPVAVIEHGQSGIILVQHGVCGAERLDQNRVWPVSRTWALENPGLATTPDKGKMQSGETRIGTGSGSTRSWGSRRSRIATIRSIGSKQCSD